MSRVKVVDRACMLCVMFAATIIRDRSAAFPASAVLTFLAVSLVACVVDAPGARTGGAASSALDSPPELRSLVALRGAQLVVIRVLAQAPEGGDGATQLALGLARGSEVTSLALPSPATHAVAWGDDAAVLSADGTLRHVTASGAAVLVARDVVTEPAVSDEGRLLAYVAHDGELDYAIRIVDAQRTHDVARGVPSAGVLRFSPDARVLLFVGRSAGGVAGLHAITLMSGDGTTPASGTDTIAPRCLTNCDLVTGQPWGARFVPLPSAAAALRFVGDEVHYDDVRIDLHGGAL